MGSEMCIRDRFNGSVNKLRNDIEKIINGRVTEPWRSLLLGLIVRAY